MYSISTKYTTLLNYLFIISRLEAKQCPGIVVADIDTSAFTGKQTIKVSSVSRLVKPLKINDAFEVLGAILNFFHQPSREGFLNFY